MRVLILSIVVLTISAFGFSETDKGNMIVPYGSFINCITMDKVVFPYQSKVSNSISIKASGILYLADNGTNNTLFKKAVFTGFIEPEWKSFRGNVNINHVKIDGIIYDINAYGVQNNYSGFKGIVKKDAKNKIISMSFESNVMVEIMFLKPFTNGTTNFRKK